MINIVTVPVGSVETPPMATLSPIITNNNSIAVKSPYTLLSQDLRKTCSGHNRNCAVVELCLGVYIDRSQADVSYKDTPCEHCGKS